jgi:autotransporter-associated beta strand protein
LLTVGGVISDGATATAITKGGSGTLVLSGPNSFSGIFTVNTGVLNIQNNLALGSTAGGTVIADGAKLQMQNSITVSGESLTTGFLESVSGNNVWAGNVLGPAATQFTLTSDTGAGLTVTGTVNANGHTMILTGGGSGEISGAISGVFNPGGLNMNGTGTWVLSGPNTYAAPTVVNAGNLQVGKAGTGQTGTLTVTVSSAGTLSGSGSIVGAATVTGAVSPGDNSGSSTGQLSFKSGLTFNPSSATTSALLNLTNGASGDNIHITGAVTLNSNSNFVVTFDPGYSVNGGDTWTLMDWTGLLTLGGFDTGTNLRSGANVGNEGNLDLPDLSQFPGYSGQVWQISALTDGSTGGALTITVVPEPGRVLLLILGAWAIALRRKRRSG